MGDFSSVLGWACQNQEFLKVMVGAWAAFGGASILADLRTWQAKAPPWLQAILHFVALNWPSVVRAIVAAASAARENGEKPQ